MTCCVAALCQDRETIVLVADKEIGAGYVWSNPDTRKFDLLAPNWWIMLSGTVSSCNDIIYHTQGTLRETGTPSADAVAQAVYEAYCRQRKVERNANDGNLVTQVALIVAGFDAPSAEDAKPVGHIILVDDQQAGGVPQWLYRPGFAAIGSGSLAAHFFLSYRDYSSTVKLREAVYYAFEAKYYGEFASGVSTETDLFIIRYGAEPIDLSKAALEDSSPLVKACKHLEVGNIDTDVARWLNAIPQLNEIDAENVTPETTRKHKEKSATITATASAVIVPAKDTSNTDATG